MTSKLPSMASRMIVRNTRPWSWQRVVSLHKLRSQHQICWYQCQCQTSDDTGDTWYVRQSLLMSTFATKYARTWILVQINYRLQPYSLYSLYIVSSFLNQRVDGNEEFFYWIPSMYVLDFYFTQLSLLSFWICWACSALIKVGYSSINCDSEDWGYLNSRTSPDTRCANTR